MGELIRLDAHRRPARRRKRPTLAEFGRVYPEHAVGLIVLAHNGVAHGVDWHMTELMRAGIDAYHEAAARTPVRRIGSAVSWTRCGQHGTGTPPDPDTLVCLRCYPWWHT